MLEIEPSAIVPRRAPGVMGRKPAKFPDLHYQVVGAALNVSPTWIGRILNGVYRPSMKLAEKLAAYMGWTIDQVNSLYRPKVKIANGDNQNAKSGNGRKKATTTARRPSGNASSTRKHTARPSDRSGKARTGRRKRK